MKVHSGIYFLILYIIPTESYYTGYSINEIPSYYTTTGLTVNVDSCTVAACVKCPKGQFNAGCGYDDARISQQNCIPCTSEKPANSSYDDFPGIAGGFFPNSTAVCPWVCIPLFQKNAAGTGCELTSCSVTLPSNSEYQGGATPLNGCPFICSAGYYGNSAINPSSCSPCDAGSYTGAGTSSCTNCIAGTYSSKSASVSIAVCTSCPQGNYSSNPGSSSCTACIPGTFSAAYGLASNLCASCPGGTYSSYGAAQCTPCPRGKYTPGTGSTTSDACVNCPAGTYSDSTTGVQACTQCPEGTASTIVGSQTQTDCAGCLAGKYTQSKGQTICANCSIGSYQDANSQSSCKLCTDAQNYADVPGLTACIPCGTCLVGQFRTSCLKDSAGYCTGCTKRP